MKLVGLDSLLVWPGGVSLGSLGLMCKYRIKLEGRQSEGKCSENTFWAYNFVPKVVVGITESS